MPTDGKRAVHCAEALGGRVLAACPDQGAAIFLQTDIKKAGAWIDKGYLVQKAGEAEGRALLWHRSSAASRPAP